MATTSTPPRRAAAPSAQPPVRVLVPRRPGLLRPAVDAWRQRGLVPVFGRQLLAKLYMRTWLGWLWVPLRPGIDVALRVVVLGTLLGSPSPDVPYLIYALVGLAAWQLFETTALWATRSLEIARRVLVKIDVARLTAVLGALWPGGLYFGMYVLTIVLAAGWFLVADGTTHLLFGPQLWLALAGLVLAAVLALAIGAVLSVFAARARDVRFAMTYALGFWFFVTPILYPVSQLGGALRTVVVLNPMTAPVDLVKHGLLGTPLPGTVSLVSCLVATVALVPVALAVFNRFETAAVDAM